MECSQILLTSDTALIELVPLDSPTRLLATLLTVPVEEGCLPDIFLDLARVSDRRMRSSFFLSRRLFLAARFRALTSQI